MNASAGLVSGFKARDFKEGVKIARESIDSGMALEKLMRLVSITNG
jgi:anthranilate phosphoribosyltransferase